MDRDLQPVLIEAYEDEIDRRSEKSREGVGQRRGGPSSGSQQHQAQQSRIASRDRKPAAEAEKKSRTSITYNEACGGDDTTSESARGGGLSPPKPSAKRRRNDQATDPRRVLMKGARGRGDTARARGGLGRMDNRDYVVDHTYHDFSRIPPPCDFRAGPSLKATPTQQEGVELCTGIEKSFPLLLHKVLSMEEFAGYVSWRSHGRAFRILNAKRFESVVCPEFFGHSRYGTFIRNLANWGFKYITQGHDRSCYYHEAFLYDLPHLTKYMSIEKNRRKVAPDPKNEPDFYLMNKASPLPRLPNGKCGAASAATATAPALQERRLSGLDSVGSSLISGEAARPTSSPFDGVAAPAAGLDKPVQEGSSEDLSLARMSKHHARVRGEAARTPASMFATAALAMNSDDFLLTGRNQVRDHQFFNESRLFCGNEGPMNNFRFSSAAATTDSNYSQQFERSESSLSFSDMHPLPGSLRYGDHQHGIATSRAAATSVMDQIESTIDSTVLGGRLGQQQAAPPPVGRYSAEDLFSPPHLPQHSHNSGSDFFRQHLSQNFAPYSKQP